MAPPSASGALFSPASLNLPARPTTRDRERDNRFDSQQTHPQASLSAVRSSSKERKASFSSLKASLPGSRRRGNASATASSSNAAVTDASAPPALPEYAHALAAAVKITAKDGAGKEREKEKDKDKDKDKDRRDAIEGPLSPESASMIPRAATASSMAPATPIDVRPGLNSTMWALAQGEAHVIHQQITETAQKRVSTLDYLRKA